MSDPYLAQIVMKGGPFDGRIKINDGPSPYHVNERVRFTENGVEAVYHLNADGTGTWIL